MAETKENDLVYISEEKLVESFKTLGPKTAVTEGHYRLHSVAEIQDMDWNHMDHLHRHFIHQLYGETLRIARGEQFAVSLTKIKSGLFKFLVMVTDVRIKPGVFYQVFSVFNIIYVHNITRAVQEPGQEGSLRFTSWYIVSSSWFKFLHPFINRKMQKVNSVQNPQDVPVLVQRTDLRKRGFSFASDNPNYLNSNTLTMNVKYPKIGEPCRISLESLAANGVQKIAAGPVHFLIERQSGGSLRIWLGECPHEGAPLETGVFNGCEVKCPWHGLKFSALVLDGSHPVGHIGNFKLEFSGSGLTVSDKK